MKVRVRLPIEPGRRPLKLLMILIVLRYSQDRRESEKMKLKSSIRSGQA